MSYTKAFDNWTWHNKSVAQDTPLSAENLQKINDGLDTVDDRVIELEDAMPTKTSDLTNDSDFAIDSEVLHTTGDESATGTKTLYDVIVTNDLGVGNSLEVGDSETPAPIDVYGDVNLYGSTSELKFVGSENTTTITGTGVSQSSSESFDIASEQVFLGDDEYSSTDVRGELNVVGDLTTEGTITDGDGNVLSDKANDSAVVHKTGDAIGTSGILIGEDGKGKVAFTSNGDLYLGATDTVHVEDNLEVDGEADFDSDVRFASDVYANNSIEVSGDVVADSDILLNSESLTEKLSVVATSATGNPVVLTNAAPIDVVGLTMDVEPIQTGSGTPSPENIRPISGRDEVEVSTTDGTTTNTTTLTLPSTLYGGTVDWVNGTVTVTHGYIESYDGETINEPWISSMDEYVSGATPTTGAQVVYTLATPTTLTLTPTMLTLLDGTNTVSGDGDMTVEYQKSNLLGVAKEYAYNLSQDAVHKTGDETIAGEKTFTDTVNVQGDSPHLKVGTSEVDGGISVYGGDVFIHDVNETSAVNFIDTNSYITLALTKDGIATPSTVYIAKGYNHSESANTGGNLDVAGLLTASNFSLGYDNAGFHNSIYRGKSLGTSVSAEQYEAISTGTFDDMFIGDYWTIDGTVYRIAAFDYWLNTGDTACTKHHVILVPDENLYTAKMNDSNDTTGGYVGSVMYTTNLATAKSTIETAFGSAHILSHRELLTNAVTDGASSGWAWCDSTVELMNEVMVYGCNVWSSKPGFDTGIDKVQLPLFRLKPDLICNRVYWWLRCVSSATSFALADYNGYASSGNASISRGVRPVFAICASE